MTKKLLKYLTFFSNWTEDDTNSFSKIALKWLLFTQWIRIIHSYNTHFIKPYRSPPNFGKVLWNMNHIFLLRPKTAKIYQETKIYKIHLWDKKISSTQLSSSTHAQETGKELWNEQYLDSDVDILYGFKVELLLNEENPAGR